MDSWSYGCDCPVPAFFRISVSKIMFGLIVHLSFI